MSGRKTKHESRAAELQAKLAVWNQTAESARPSLRGLARELGTSHQLLSHYLAGLEEWMAREQKEAYEREAEEIRRKGNEDVSFRVLNCKRLAFCEQQADRWHAHEMVAKLTSSSVRAYTRDAKRGLLDPRAVKFLPQLVGDSQGRRILQLQSKAESRVSSNAKAALHQLARINDPERWRRILSRLLPQERAEGERLTRFKVDKK
jgi:hypothetical protein